MKLSHAPLMLFFRNLPAARRKEAMVWGRIYLAFGALILLATGCTCVFFALQSTASPPESVDHYAAFDHMWEAALTGLGALGLLAGGVWGMQHMIDERGPTLGQVLEQANRSGQPEPGQSAPRDSLAAD